MEHLTWVCTTVFDCQRPACLAEREERVRHFLYVRIFGFDLQITAEGRDALAAMKGSSVA